jgi:TRAP-type C4-dicarboxylate transport system permease small subunit
MRIIELIARNIHYVGEAVILVVVCLVVTDIVGRAIGHPVRGTYEMYTYGTGVGVVLVFAYAQIMGRHIRIEMLTHRLAPRTQEVLIIIGQLVALAALALMTYGTVKYSLFLLERHERSSLLEIAVFPFPMVFALGILVFWLVFLSQLITSLRRMVRK